MNLGFTYIVNSTLYGSNVPFQYWLLSNGCAISIMYLYFQTNTLLLPSTLLTKESNQVSSTAMYALLGPEAYPVCGWKSG